MPLLSSLKKFGKEILSGPRSYLGVDIGTTSIKAVEMKSGKQRPKLINYALFEISGHLQRINAALQTSSLKLYDREVADYLKLVVKKADFESRQAVASVPAFSAFTTLIDIPMLSEEETGQTLQFRAKQYIPLPADSITIDWVKVGERTNESGNKVQQIFLAAIPNNNVKQYQNIFRMAGLELAALEVDGFSLARALSVSESKAVLIVDIGSRSTSFLLANNGLLKSISQSDFAGNSLTQSIARGLGISVRRAEDLKRLKGLSDMSSGPDRELSTLLLPSLDVIINTAKRAKGDATSVVLTGGGACMPGVEDYFKREMNLPVHKAKPFVGIDYPSELELLTDKLGPLLATAIGLGGKYL